MLNRIVTLFVLLCGTTLWGFAAEDGEIKGRVTEAQTGESLPGANVFIAGSSLGAATDLNGNYRIPNVPPGSYTLVVRYIGYKEEKLSVRVTANETLVQNVQLFYEGLTGEEVTVIAQAKGQMAAINKQLSA